MNPRAATCFTDPSRESSASVAASSRSELTRHSSVPLLTTVMVLLMYCTPEQTGAGLRASGAALVHHTQAGSHARDGPRLEKKGTTDLHAAAEIHREQPCVGNAQHSPHPSGAVACFSSLVGILLETALTFDTPYVLEQGHQGSITIRLRVIRHGLSCGDCVLQMQGYIFLAADMRPVLAAVHSPLPAPRGGGGGRAGCGRSGGESARGGSEPCCVLCCVLRRSS